MSTVPPEPHARQNIPMPTPGEATTEDILKSASHALRIVRDYLDYLSTDGTREGQKLHLVLQHAAISVCQQTERVLVNPADAPARATHAQAVEHLLYVAEVAQNYLEADEAAHDH